MEWVKKFHPSLRRGVAHVAVGLLISSVSLYVSEVVFLPILCAVTITLLCIELFRFIFPAVNRQFYALLQPFLRESEASHLTGASYFLLGALISFVIFERDIAVASVLFLSIGDSLSAIVTGFYGKRKLFKKTLEGDIACLIACLVTGLITYFAGLDISLPVLIIGAVVAAIVEALPLPIDDNITIPIFSGLVMTLVQFWL